MSKTDKYSTYGVDKESYERGKDILPTFKLGEIEAGSSAFVEILEAEPRTIEVKSKFEKDKDKTKKVPIINVHVEKVMRKEGNEFIEVPIGQKLALFLSSKSLASGMLKVSEDNGDTLLGCKVKIEVGLTEYKEFGENRVYNVTQI